jgi:hypothetical protein
MRLIQTVIIRLQIVFLAFRFRAGPLAQNPFSKICLAIFLWKKNTYLKNLYIVKSYHHITRLMRLIQAVIISLHIVFLAFRFRAGPLAQNPFSKN